MNPVNKKVVVIDDDAANNFIFKIILNRLCRNAQPEIIDFTLPEEGLRYLSRVLTDDSDIPVVLFLDVNMPILMGWDVLDRLSLLPESGKERLTIFMLSSSIDPADEKKANEHPLVERFLSKPITTDMVWIEEFLMNDLAKQAS